MATDIVIELGDDRDTTYIVQTVPTSDGECSPAHSSCGKPGVLAVFRQLEDADIINPLDASLSGEPWGRINYHPAKCADEKEHIHVVWQQDPIVVDLNDAVRLNGQLNRLARQAARERFPWDWGNRIAVKAHRRYLRQRRIILGNATSCTFPAKAFHQMGREGLGTVTYFAEGLGGDLDRLALALKRHQTAAAKAIGEVVTARARNLKYACQ